MFSRLNRHHWRLPLTGTIPSPLMSRLSSDAGDRNIQSQWRSSSSPSAGDCRTKLGRLPFPAGVVPRWTRSGVPLVWGIGGIALPRLPWSSFQCSSSSSVCERCYYCCCCWWWRFLQEAVIPVTPSISTWLDLVAADIVDFPSLSNVGRTEDPEEVSLNHFWSNGFSFAHVLETQLQRFEATYGRLREHVTVERAEGQTDVRLCEPQPDAALLEMLGEYLQIVRYGQVLVGEIITDAHAAGVDRRIVLNRKLGIIVTRNGSPGADACAAIGHGAIIRFDCRCIVDAACLGGMVRVFVRRRIVRSCVGREICYAEQIWIWRGQVWGQVRGQSRAQIRIIE